MKDLRIIIVTWNSERSIEKCLSSLKDACLGLTWDAVLVDNASIDTSVERARRLVEAQGLPVRIIQNQKNRGFSRACNQALATADAQFVLLLNPDTVCPALALFRLVMIAQACPQAGIFGPRLTFADGRAQPSVRRFPALWDQLGVLLKLPHLLPWLPMFKRYWAVDLDGRREQNVDQVMGACFLIRQKMIEQIGGLDERFFIWFEEVDYCRQARAAGWDVRYVPAVSIIHHGGESFAQVMTERKQKNFLESLVKYFQKWHAGWRAHLINCFTPAARLLVWLTGRGGVEEAEGSTEQSGASREWVLWLFGILVLELISLAFVFWPVGRSLLCVLAGIVLLALSIGKPDLGLAVVFLELLIGSKGALLKIPAGWNFDQGTSLRMVFLGAFMLGWMVNAAGFWQPRKTNWRAEIYQMLKGRGAWLALALLCFWGFWRGIWLGNTLLLKDANAWGFLILLIPVVDLAGRVPGKLLKHSSQALIAGLLWLPLKTLGLLYVFSHGLKSLSHPLYLWVRRTGVGEVTLVTGNLFRIFMQSQIYALAGFLSGAANLILNEKTETPNAKSGRRIIWAVMCVSAISILISLSRSFWVGLFFGLLCLLWLKIQTVRGWVTWPAVRGIFSAVAVGFALIFAVVAFPMPQVDVGSLATLFGSRGGVSDVAAESRWNLLPVLWGKIKQAPLLGSGFGATVTYQTKDPRILAQNPDGWYTTHAFEWGWLEHWIKFGLLGIPVLVWLLASLIRRLWVAPAELWIRAGFISSLVALAVLHIFTPYLNHPLGFGFLLAAEAYITIKSATRNDPDLSPA